MANRSTFPTQIDTFTYLSEVLASDKTNIDRYQELLMKSTRTTAEETELTNLKTTLATKIVSAENFNKMFDCIVNLESFFKNDVEAYLATLEVGAIRADLGTPTNLTTAAKSNLVSAVNEVQSETDSAHTKIGTLSGLTTTQKGTVVGAINEVDSNVDTHTASKSNPHNTTAAQVGAYTKAESDDKYVHGSGERTEICSLLFFTNGGSHTSTANYTFSKAFTNPPTVMPANITNPASYVDVIRYPYIYNVTKTGFSVKITTGDSGLELGSIGSPINVAMRFIAIGK